MHEIRELSAEKKKLEQLLEENSANFNAIEKKVRQECFDEVSKFNSHSIFSCIPETHRFFLYKLLILADWR